MGFIISNIFPLITSPFIHIPFLIETAENSKKNRIKIATQLEHSIN